MNKILNSNNIIYEKYLNKGIVRSFKFKNSISDMNNFQFDFKNKNFKKILPKSSSLKKIFFNKDTFTYFKRQKKDLKFLFLRKITKFKQVKHNNILQNTGYLKSNCLITKPIKKGFRIFSHKYKGFIKRENLAIIIKKFKIHLLKNSNNLSNRIYLINLHKLRNFIFHKLLFAREIKNNYNNFKFLTKKSYNKKKRIKKLKLYNKIALKFIKNSKIDKKHEKKIDIKKRIKNNYKHKNIKKKNYNKYPKGGISVKQK